MIFEMNLQTKIVAICNFCNKEMQIVNHAVMNSPNELLVYIQHKCEKEVN